MLKVDGCALAGEVWPMHIPGSASQVNVCLIQGKCYITDSSEQEQ